MTRYFCCCIPVRAAVFVFSLLTILISGFVAGSAIWGLSNIHNPNYPSLHAFNAQQMGILIGVSIVYGLVCLSAIAGFVGSIARKRALVALYSVMTIIGFGLQTGIDSYFLYTMWRRNSTDPCANLPKDQINTPDAENLCRKAFHSSRVVVTIALVVFWLIQLYITVVIRRYVKQLDEDKYYDAYKSNYSLGPTSNASYPEQAPLTAGHYPYTDPLHGFGSHHP